MSESQTSPEPIETTTSQKNEHIYLKRLQIKNYRGISFLDIGFQAGVNVILGENNIGKSSVIDAIRTALDVGRYRKAAYIHKTDFRDENVEIEFDLYFYIPEDKDGFHEMLALEDGQHELQLHVRFRLAGGVDTKRVLVRYWGGSSGHKMDENVIDAFHVQYLGALRDAETQLRPSSVGQLAELLKKLVSSKEDREKIEKLFGKVHSEEEIKKLVDNAKDAIEAHLEGIALNRDKFGIHLSPLPPDFEKITGGFGMQLVQQELTFDIAQNGMGYNNVLFISTVLGHIQHARELSADEYYGLLIEEPEAHLHPQLEDSLFHYICKLGDGSGAQIITTSHSPVIASECDLDRLTLLCDDVDGKVQAVSLKSIHLTKGSKLKLQRFLDVTKSQLFFAKGIIFVEGISEALLLPALADAHFHESRSLINMGIEVVNIGGVSFAPFAELFNGDPHIPLRAAILTDRDATGEAMSPRAANALALKANTLDVFISETKTFEADMWDAGNAKIMGDVYGALHIDTKIASSSDLVDKLESNQDKALFAQQMAFELDAASHKITLKVPPYIQSALEWAVNAKPKQVKDEEDQRT